MNYLLATTNKAKIRYYGTKLKEKGLDIVTLNDLNIEIDVDETGKNPIENAIIKATEYNKLSNIPTIALDEGYPLASIQIIESVSKFKSELTEEEEKNNMDVEQKDIFDFILNTITSMKQDKKLTKECI